MVSYREVVFDFTKDGSVQAYQKKVCKDLLPIIAT